MELKGRGGYTFIHSTNLVHLRLHSANGLESVCALLDERTVFEFSFCFFFACWACFD